MHMFASSLVPETDETEEVPECPIPTRLHNINPSKSELVSVSTREDDEVGAEVLHFGACKSGRSARVFSVLSFTLQSDRVRNTPK